jgi:diadenosine tetraphosphate (Ap4A) HIT family hydrolase
MQEYLSLQRLVYQVGEALRGELPTERLYIMSLGSQSGNRHVHWHVAPLPPGVPYAEQQFAAFSPGTGACSPSLMPTGRSWPGASAPGLRPSGVALAP